MFCEVRGLIKIYFHGSPFEASFERLLETIAEREVSPYIKAAKFSGPDEGSNGTRHWNFNLLLGDSVMFRNLMSFEVEGTQPQHHNRSIISGNYYEEGGMIAQLIKKMPNLSVLSVPSAPNHEFFNMASHPLRHLIVQTGYDTQRFLYNIGRSSCFNRLHILDFSDFQETYIQDCEEHCTPFSEYQDLFLSSNLANLKIIILRNSNCSDEQIATLKSLRKDTLFILIKSTSKYV